MKIFCGNTAKGIRINFDDTDFRLTYPNDIWKSYPQGIKEILIDNLSHLLTIDTPLIAGQKSVSYNTSEPIFRETFRQMVLKSIPSAVESYDEDTNEIIRKFKEIVYMFDGPKKWFDFSQDIENRAITPLSFGKDSLLTLAVANEVGLRPRPVYINDTVSPIENKTKIQQIKLFSKEFGQALVVKNGIEKLNDFEYWDKDETCLSYMHMVTGFCFIALPIANHYNARYIILGNQKDMDFSFINKDEYLTYPSPDQTTEWMNKQNEMINKMTKNVSVTSLISPLTNIAIMKILFNRYKQYAKYEISCDCLEGTNEKRWCHECNKCARLFLFISAVGADPRLVGFTKNMLEKQNKNLFTLFKSQDNYEKSKEARDQQLLAFYMALKNNVQGSLIDVFKKEFLEEAKEREDELYKKFFTVYDTPMPRELNDVKSIYKEELV